MVRNYTGEAVDPAALERILQIATRGPSAGFSQGQSFVVVTDPDRRERIAEMAREPAYVAQGFDPWISRAPVLVVCCTSEKLYRDRYSETDKLRADGSTIEWPVPYWFIDAGAAVCLLLTAAVDEGLSAGFLGLDDEGYVQLKQMLGIPEPVTPFGLVTIGHGAPDRPSGSLQRGWRPREQVIHYGSWGA